jgi:hypothetical protein
MARGYGRFTTSIWLDPDFTSLTLEQQGAYFTLGLQPDVTAAGVLPYTSRRWSKLSAGMTREGFEHLVELLAKSDGEHLVVDEDTEEVLIRKFMKWDMGWANTQKRMQVVLDAVDAIASSRIRDSAIRELWKIPDSGIGTDASRDALSRALNIRYPDNADTVTRSDRVVVTTRSRTTGNPLPETTTHNPHPGNLEPGAGSPSASAEPPAPFCSKHPNGTDEPCKACGTARLRFDAWRAAAPQRALADKASDSAAETRAKNCPLCHGTGWIENSDGDPIARCNHLRSAS